MNILRPCPFCAKPVILNEIMDDYGIELRHESKDCPLDGFLGWFETKEQAINSNFNNRPIEDILKESFNEVSEKNKKLRITLNEIAYLYFYDNNEKSKSECIADIRKAALDALNGENDVR